jgi:hypothetical protein
LASKGDDSARVQLIKTRRGTWIDKRLLPAARRECLAILQAASKAVGEDVVKIARGDTRRLEEELLASNPYYLKLRQPQPPSRWTPTPTYSRAWTTASLMLWRTPSRSGYCSSNCRRPLVIEPGVSIICLFAGL